MAELLPAALWASVLSKFCSYQDVRSCLEVTSFFRNDIAPLIQRLYIFHARELHPESASRFPIVEAVYVYSLTSLPHKDKVSEVEDDMSFSIETARNVVSFLQAFPNLVFCHIGGYTPMYPDAQKIAMDGTHCDLPYCHYLCKTDGHQAAFRDMLNNFCMAFQRGLLNSNQLQLSGLFDAPFMQRQLDCTKDARCELCPRICQSFKIGFVSVLTDSKVCMLDEERLKIVYQRDENFLKSSNALKVLLNRNHLTMVRKEWIVHDNATGNYLLHDAVLWAVECEESDLNMMRFLCKECGCDPSTVLHEEVLQSVTRMYDPNTLYMWDGKHYMKTATFDALTSIGFDIRATDIEIIDENQER